MPRLTIDILRSRAEHNEMMLTNLEEISLHQQELEAIELLETYCRHLKILYLQNNIIEKMEGLNKLKELEYLNLALNNISKIENISGCESLKKLDLTCNFVSLENLKSSAEELSKLPQLKELYLIGNPCTDWKPHWKDFILAHTPKLEVLDGKNVAPSEKIKAYQNLPQLLQIYEEAVELEKIQEERKEHEYQIEKEIREKEYAGLTEEEIKQKKKEEKMPYSRETRRELYLQQAQEKIDKEKRNNPEKFEKKEPTPIYTKDGEIRQCNEGKYKFLLDEWSDGNYTIFTMDIPKHLDTSQVQVSLNPTYLSIRIKDKLTQLRLQDEISVENSTVQRVLITSKLEIKMKKINPNETLTRIKQREEQEKAEKIKQEKERKIREEKERRDKTEHLINQFENKLKYEDKVTFDDVPDLE